MRDQVTLPIQATYLQIRRFVASLLNEIPALAVESESVTMGRKQPTDRVVDAQLKLTLFLPAGRRGRSGSWRPMHVLAPSVLS